MLAQEAAKAQGGRLPLDVLLAPAIKHAREGYTVTRSQARLTREKLPEMDDAAGFHAAFLVDGKPPEVGARHQAKRACRHARASRRCRARRFLPRRRRARDRRRSRAHRQPGDARRSGKIPRLCRRAALRAHTRPARSTTRRRRRKAWPRSSSSALFERLRVAQAESFEHVHGIVEATKRAFRVRDRVITDPDTITADLGQFLSPAFLDADAGKIDPQARGEMAAAPRRGRHHLDGRGGRIRPRRLLHPVALLGVRLRLRAAGDRRADAEPRRQLLARSPRRSTRWRRAGCRSTPSTRRWPN